MPLWLFLIAVLRADHKQICLSWKSFEKYEFVVKDKKLVAKLWGLLKQNPAMDYLKLTRALRYYYKKELIEKVSFVHKRRRTLNLGGCKLSARINNKIRKKSVAKFLRNYCSFSEKPVRMKWVSTQLGDCSPPPLTNMTMSISFRAYFYVSVW